MITATMAYRKLKNKLPNNLKIIDGFEINDAFIFSVTNGENEYPFYSVSKRDGSIGGYNPMQNIPEYMNAIKNRAIDIESLDKPLPIK